MNCPHCNVHVDEHEAGRCMDAWVATEVMGIPVESAMGYTVKWLLDDCNYKPEEFPYEFYHCRRYSTDIAAAWQAVEKLAASEDWDEHPVDVHKNYAFKDMWTAHFRDYSVVAHADTASLAICRAALKACNELP